MGYLRLVIYKNSKKFKGNSYALMGYLRLVIYKNPNVERRLVKISWHESVITQHRGGIDPFMPKRPKSPDCFGDNSLTKAIFLKYLEEKYKLETN